MCFNRAILVGLVLLGLVSPASATIFFQTDFENAIVPNDPSNCTDLGVTNVMNNGFQGAPPGWILWRAGSNTNNNCAPFNGGSFGPDQCFFTTEQAHSGTKSLKIMYTVAGGDGNTAGNDECSVAKGNDLSLPTFGTAMPDVLEFWMVAWVRPHNYGINLVTVSENKLIYFHTTGSSGYPNTLLEMYNNGGVVPAMAPQNSVDCYGFPNPGLNLNCFTSWNGFANQGAPQMTQDTWHCLELHYKMNSVTGTTPNRDAVFESWVDSTGGDTGLTMRYSNFAFRAGTVSTTTASVDARFRAFQIYRQGAALNSVMYWDDIAVGDARIGCGGAIQPPAPADPCCLTVTQLLYDWFLKWLPWAYQLTRAYVV